ncbi:hypothetical protein HZC09_01645 [Candidatus Micrarchaeota archaeon]|nr:hypothetical protein [Candidatus Micrarchaeota archaeon]
MEKNQTDRLPILEQKKLLLQDKAQTVQTVVTFLAILASATMVVWGLRVGLQQALAENLNDKFLKYVFEHVTTQVWLMAAITIGLLFAAYCLHKDYSHYLSELTPDLQHQAPKNESNGKQSKQKNELKESGETKKENERQGQGRSLKTQKE